MKSNSVMENYKNIYENERMSDEAVAVMKQRMADAKREKKMSYTQTYKKLAIAAAVALMILVAPNTSSTVAYAMGNMPLLGSFFKLVTIRDYSYDDGNNTADVNVAEVVVEKENATPQDEALKNATDEINKDVEAIADKFIKEFNDEKTSQGYSNLKIDSEIVNTTDKYFTLKLTCSQSSADSYTETHFYTIDLKTGKKLELADLFKDGVDYKKVLQDEIYSQMRNEMNAGGEKSYWVDDETEADWTFDSVGEDAFFYMNSEGKLVIGFNEGAVGPMSNGVTEFVIPASVMDEISR